MILKDILDKVINNYEHLEGTIRLKYIFKTAKTITENMVLNKTDFIHYINNTDFYITIDFNGNELSIIDSLVISDIETFTNPKWIEFFDYINCLDRNRKLNEFLQ